MASTSSRSPQVADRLELGLVRGEGPVPVVGLYYQDTRADAFEADDAGTRQRPAIDADVVGAQAGGDAGGIEDLRVQLRNLHPQPAPGLVPVERNESVELLEPGDPVFD